MFPPERIVCLTEETVETLYLLGEERRIVGVSGYAVRPARVRKEKPRVSAFISADYGKILALAPDLVLAFSDLQADLVAELIRRNVAVHAFNQRDVAGILDMIRTVGALAGVQLKADALAASLAERLRKVREHTGALTGAQPKADVLAATLKERLRAAQANASKLARRPRVYFEEWDDPMISGIQWVSELIEIAGGVEVFPALAVQKNAKDRIVSPREVIAAAPDIIVGSWCGKKFVPAKVSARDGFDAIPAVRSGWLREIKSPLILQPGPAALTDGLDALAAMFAEWAAQAA
jgi:iron complex transport system substrate-binding protein